jgi:hypothetical protein
MCATPASRLLEAIRTRQGSAFFCPGSRLMAGGHQALSRLSLHHAAADFVTDAVVRHVVQVAGDLATRGGTLVVDVVVTFRSQEACLRADVDAARAIGEHDGAGVGRCLADLVASRRERVAVDPARGAPAATVSSAACGSARASASRSACASASRSACSARGSACASARGSARASASGSACSARGSARGSACSACRPAGTASGRSTASATSRTGSCGATGAPAGTAD